MSSTVVEGLTPPYYAVVFTSLERVEQEEGYDKMAARMLELVQKQPGYLGHESSRSDDGLGITVSYWESLESIRAWGRHTDHLQAQELGKAAWYSRYRLRICRVEEQLGFWA